MRPHIGAARCQDGYPTADWPCQGWRSWGYESRGSSELRSRSWRAWPPPRLAWPPANFPPPASSRGSDLACSYSRLPWPWSADGLRQSGGPSGPATPSADRPLEFPQEAPRVHSSLWTSFHSWLTLGIDSHLD